VCTKHPPRGLCSRFKGLITSFLAPAAPFAFPFVVIVAMVAPEGLARSAAIAEGPRASVRAVVNHRVNVPLLLCVDTSSDRVLLVLRAAGAMASGRGYWKRAEQHFTGTYGPTNPEAWEIRSFRGPESLRRHDVSPRERCPVVAAAHDFCPEKYS
jgi:hypothetical protein